MRNDGEQVLMSSIEKALLFMLIITTNNEELDLKNFIEGTYLLLRLDCLLLLIIFLAKIL